MVRLLINVDHVATLRQQRDTIYPDPVVAAGMCELAGADGVTIHLREDRRHAQERDVRILRQTVRGSLNLEMAVVPSIIDIAAQVVPEMCTLVPEKREERTTEGGLDVRGRGAEIGKAVRRLRDAGIEVSLFIDPDEESARVCADLGASQAELHTGDYCHAKVGSVAASRELARLERAGRIVVDNGLGRGPWSRLRQRGAGRGPGQPGGDEHRPRRHCARGAGRDGARRARHAQGHRPGFAPGASRVE
jgi:pyridoxine 5-phosphate synthase